MPRPQPDRGSTRAPLSRGKKRRASGSMPFPRPAKEGGFGLSLTGVAAAGRPLSTRLGQRTAQTRSASRRQRTPAGAAGPFAPGRPAHSCQGLWNPDLPDCCSGTIGRLPIAPLKRGMSLMLWSICGRPRENIHGSPTF
ncbi:MAG: hypothetical protein MZV63_19355 [Marinilabiliales bacterium]|nr:hypothetical protein [Marinilabiliales bacterium]